MATGLWTDYAATSFAGGNGTSSSPYQISTPAQLAYFAKLIKNSNTTYRDSYFQLTADIDLSAHYWSPIGTSSTPFRRTFDGQYHKISNMTIDTSIYSSDVIGLFGYTSTPSTTEIAEIKNFYLVSPHIIDNDATYASFVLANHTNRVSIHGIEITDGYYSYKSTNISTKTNTYFGCFLGIANYISNCYVSLYNLNAIDIQIRSQKQYNGGVVGYYKASTNNNIYDINIILDECIIRNNKYYFGGIVGYIYDNMSYNLYLNDISVTIEDSMFNSSNSSGFYAGGIIGYMYNYSSTIIKYINMNRISSDVTSLTTTIKAYVGGWYRAVTMSTIKSNNKMSKLFYNTNGVDSSSYTSGIVTDTEDDDIITDMNYTNVFSNMYDPLNNWSHPMLYYNVAWRIACRTFSVQSKISGSVTYRSIVRLNDMYKRGHSLSPIKVILLYNFGDYNPYESHLYNSFLLATGSTFTFPDSDKYTYLRPTLILKEMSSSNKWIVESQQITSTNTGVTYSPGDTISLSTDMILYTGELDKTKIISYKKDSSTTVDVEDIYYKNSSSTIKTMNDYKYKKDSSTII